MPRSANKSSTSRKLKVNRTFYRGRGRADRKNTWGATSPSVRSTRGIRCRFSASPPRA